MSLERLSYTPEYYSIRPLGLPEDVASIHNAAETDIQDSVDQFRSYTNPATAPSHLLPSLDYLARMDAHDSHTGTHSREVGVVFLTATTLLGLENHLELALCHDAGKFDIPGSILQADNLTDEQRTMIQFTHIDAGPKYLWPIAQASYPDDIDTQRRFVGVVQSHHDATEYVLGKFNRIIPAYRRFHDVPHGVERRRYSPTESDMTYAKILSIADKVARRNGFTGQASEFGQAYDTVIQSLAVNGIDPVERYTGQVLTAISYGILAIPRAGIPR